MRVVLSTILLIAITAVLPAQDLPTPSAEELARMSVEELIARADQARGINFPASRLFYDEAVRRDPDNPVALCKRATATQYLTPDATAADYKRAADAFLARMKQDPANTGLPRRLLQLAEDEAYHSSRIVLYDALLAHDPDDVDALLARQALTADFSEVDPKPEFKDYARAFGILDGWIRKGAADEARARALKALAGTHDKIRVARGLFVSERLLKWNPDDVEVLIIRSELHTYTHDESKDWDQESSRVAELYWTDRNRALAILTAAIGEDPTSTAPRLQRIQIAPNSELRLADATALIEINPADPAAWIRRAELRAWESMEESIRDYTRALELDPDNRVALVGRAVRQHSSGELESAIEGYTRLLELDPADGKAYQRRATSYEALGDKTRDDTLNVKAIVDLLKARKLGHEEESRMRIGHMIEALGRAGQDPKVALENLTSVIESDATCAEAYLERASLHSRGKRIVEALADIEVAIRLKPQDDRLIDRKFDCYAIDTLDRRDHPILLQAAFDDATRMLATRPTEELKWRLNRGRILTRLHREKEALAELDRAVTLAPADSTCWRYRALAFREFGKPVEAIADLTKAIELAPKDTELRRERARLCVDQESPCYLVEDCEIYLKEFPGTKLAIRGWMSIARDRLEKWERRVEEVSQRIRADPERPEGYTERASLHATMRDWAKVIEDHSRAVDLSDPASVDALTARALAFERMGEADKALADWDTALERSPQFRNARVRRAAHRVRRGEHANAIEDFTLLVKENPEAWEYLRSRAECHLALGHGDEAMADYSKAVEVNPSDMSAWLGRGRIHRDRKDYDRALSDFRAARELEFDSVPAAAAVGSIYEACGVQDWQAVELEALIEMGSRRPDVLAERGCRRFNKGDWAGAEADFSHALAGKPDWIWCLKARIDANVQLKNFTKAWSDADRVISLAHMDGDSYKTRARVHWAWGRRTLAMEDFRKAIEISPDDPSLRAEMESLKVAVIQERISALNAEANACWNKDWTRAINLYSDALRLDPGDETVLCNRAYAYLFSGNAREARSQFDSIVKMLPGSLRARKGMEDVQAMSKAAEQAAESANYVEPQPCHTCHGRGNVWNTSQWEYAGFGIPAMERTNTNVTCSWCRGTGWQ